MASNHYVLGNGALLVNFNGHGNITDLYFPYVGHKNHVGGHLCGIAVLTPHETLWLGEGWESSGKMLDGSLVARMRFRHRATGLVLHLDQAVHHASDALLVSLELENPDLDCERFSVAFYHNFTINENVIGDTAAYLPDPGALVHYKEDVYLLAGARNEKGEPFSRWDIGRRDGSAAAGWDSINRRHFANTAIRQGNVDSVLVLDLECPRGGAASGDYWLIAGRTLDEVTQASREMNAANLPLLLEQTHLFWQEWSNYGSKPPVPVPAAWEAAYNQSQLVVRSQCDNRGGIVAANDTSVLRFNGDHYSYVWPRDAALVARIFLHQGVHDIAARFLSFCETIADARGVILHKFRANGTLGSSWHGWLHDGKPALPIQEDEIALPVLLLADYFARARNIEFARNCYIGWGRRCLRFLCDYVDPESDLPLPSHDLWEERYGVHCFTVASVWAALSHAGRMAHRLGFIEDAERCFDVSSHMQAAFFDKFWDEDAGLFARCLRTDGSRDLTPDSSTHAMWYFGLVEVSDPRLQRAMANTWESLRIRVGTGGIARYRDDYYHRVTENLHEVPGNPWIISTLWAAQWFRLNGDEDRWRELVDVCVGRRNEMGLLAEQWNPYDGAALSVTPLTWSHAVLVETLGQAMGIPAPARS